jgi:Uma2 family endonuclease
MYNPTQIIDEGVLYPSEDGKPMAANTEHFNWIVLLKENLEVLFADREDVLVVGDVFWYPVRSQLIAPTAPDVMVIFGRPKGKRKSYRQWREENIAPQVVFEILSPSNNFDEMSHKFEFYQQYGVEEYYTYNLETHDFDVWLRRRHKLVPVRRTNGWISPRLGIKFELIHGVLEVFYPDGSKFLTTLETVEQRKAAEQKAEQVQKIAEQEKQRAEQEKQRADSSDLQLQRLIAALRDRGINPDELTN